MNSHSQNLLEPISKFAAKEVLTAGHPQLRGQRTSHSMSESESEAEKEPVEEGSGDYLPCSEEQDSTSETNEEYHQEGPTPEEKGEEIPARKGRRECQHQKKLQMWDPLHMEKVYKNMCCIVPGSPSKQLFPCLDLYKKHCKRYSDWQMARELLCQDL